MLSITRHLGQWLYESGGTLQTCKGSDFVQGHIKYLMDFSVPSCVCCCLATETTAQERDSDLVVDIVERNIHKCWVNSTVS